MARQPAQGFGFMWLQIVWQQKGEKVVFSLKMGRHKNLTEKTQYGLLLADVIRHTSVCVRTFTAFSSKVCSFSFSWWHRNRWSAVSTSRWHLLQRSLSHSPILLIRWPKWPNRTWNGLRCTYPSVAPSEGQRWGGIPSDDMEVHRRKNQEGPSL